MILYLMLSLNFIMISMFLLNFSFMMLLMNNSIFLEWNMLVLSSMKMNMLIYIDWISMMFMFTVLIISSMILIYSIEYMESDKNKLVFFYLMVLFMLSMLLMIMSPNLITILLGWDGLGLISYCLVIFYQSKYSYSSGNLTIFSNLIGDIMLIMSIIIMMMNGSWNFIFLNNINLVMLMSIMIIITSFTKSAQFPFSSWLPVAMAAPTPVSSLVHSSTLVTAGIYLLILFNLLINKNYLLLILLISLITMMMSSLCAMFEFDFKKIIAYSTLSQLGMMMMIFSMMKVDLSFFHLIIHAMFKSMMFMCSGIYIHNLINFQDILYYGNMKKYFPLSSVMFMISNLSLCGTPFLSGFFSKDKILESLMCMKMNMMIQFFMLISIMMTLIYSFLLLYYLMKSDSKFLNYNFMIDSKLMNFSMLVLLLMSILMGMFLNWLIFLNIELIYLKEFEKKIILLILLSGLLIGIMLYLMLNKFQLMKMKFFFGKMWFSYYLIYLMMIIFKLGKFHYLMIDKGWNEMISKNLLMNFFNSKNLLGFGINNFMIILMLMNYLIMIYYLI